MKQKNYYHEINNNTETQENTDIYNQNIEEIKKHIQKETDRQRTEGKQKHKEQKFRNTKKNKYLSDLRQWTETEPYLLLKEE